MARVDIPVPVPDPPAHLDVSPVPDKTAADAVAWYAGIGVPVTERWIKTVTDRRELACRIVAGRRMYTTEELWRFIVTRPSRTAGAARYNRKGNRTA
ncbi:hypothetical protein [Mycobacterium sp. 3519A]|uniref:hypothetical protein n=1 Tax=Mycobacterium sp. 3519A TaxID=2057184 RepID=UPI00115C1D5E|nr:hypothetical protein [Mycobacterium sp. 3519A]